VAQASEHGMDSQGIPPDRHLIEHGRAGLPPNAPGFSGGALIERYSYQADSNLQNRHDLAGAERRPLQAIVGCDPTGVAPEPDLAGFIWRCFVAQM
jgi:hypothetical protein